jgi:hypothetical protein
MARSAPRRRRPQWDTAAADVIVREAGGVVLHAGRCTGKGEILEDWKARGPLPARGG